MIFARLALSFPLLAAAAFAQYTEAWHGVDYEWFNNQRWLLRTRAEVRSRDGYQRLLDFREAVDLRYFAAPHFSLVSNTQIVQSHATNGDFTESTRSLVGVELPFQQKRFTLTSRSAFEHYFLPGHDRYDRGRQRLSLRFQRLKFQPQLMTEYVQDQTGWAASRQSFTVLIPITPLLALDACYHFEFRPTRLGGNRQMIYTYLRIRRPHR